MRINARKKDSEIKTNNDESNVLLRVILLTSMWRTYSTILEKTMKKKQIYAFII